MYSGLENNEECLVRDILPDMKSALPPYLFDFPK